MSSRRPRLAYQIRTHSTKIFQAIEGLRAHGRCCPTGKPVQNMLEAVCSLTEFLRFYPVDNPLATRHRIVAPLGRKDHKILKGLELIMSSIALRRSNIKYESRNRATSRGGYIVPGRARVVSNISLQAKNKHTRRGRDTRAQALLRAIIKIMQSWHAEFEIGGPELQRCLPLSSVWQFFTFISLEIRGHSKRSGALSVS